MSCRLRFEGAILEGNPLPETLNSHLNHLKSLRNIAEALPGKNPSEELETKTSRPKPAVKTERKLLQNSFFFVVDQNVDIYRHQPPAMDSTFVIHLLLAIRIMAIVRPLKPKPSYDRSNPESGMPPSPNPALALALKASMPKFLRFLRNTDGLGFRLQGLGLRDPYTKGGF